MREKGMSLEESRMDINNNPLVLDASINTCEHGHWLDHHCPECEMLAGGSTQTVPRPFACGPVVRMGSHVLHERYLGAEDFEQLVAAA